MTAPLLDVVPAPTASPPRKPPPNGSVDCHSHVFGPFGTFPPKQASVYALPDAPPEAHLAVRRQLSMAYGVLTQPAPYGRDPGAMLDAIARSDGALKGIAVADAEVADETLAAWSAAGIRGLRFVEMRAPGGGRYPGSVDFAALTRMAPRLREHGLHAQLWANADQHAEWLPGLAVLGIPLAIDHLGTPAIRRGVADTSWQGLLDVLADADIWIKLTLCRLFDAAPDFADVRPFHDSLVARAPDRLLWGSDWPYVRLDPAPDAGAMLDLFDAWTDDDALRHAILADNPGRLYRFGDRE